MSSAAIASILKVGFSLSAVKERDAVVVALTGNCDMQTTPELETFLDRLQTDIRTLRLKRVVFDCQQVYFMNSASIKCFVAWIMNLRKLDESERCAIEFVFNKNLGWQKRSLDAIRRFAPEIVTLTSGDAV